MCKILTCRMARIRVYLLLVALVCASFLLPVISEEDAVVGEEGEEEKEGKGGGGGSDSRQPEGRPVYRPPKTPSGDVYFEESFSDNKAVKKKWIKSKAKKDGADADIAKYDGMNDAYCERLCAKLGMGGGGTPRDFPPKSEVSPSSFAVLLQLFATHTNNGNGIS